MSERAIGSIWTVAGVEPGMAIVLAGPFAAARGAPEYLVAPLYTGKEPGFEWTDEDVRLEAQETGLPSVQFAAIWNTRPVLSDDLVLEAGLLPAAATADVRDVYWASLNERVVSGKRIGKPIRSRRDSVALFQEAELARWAPVSGRALAGAEVEPDTRASLVSSVAFSLSGTSLHFAFRTDSMAWLLCADPSSIADEVLGRTVPLLWYASSMGRTEQPEVLQAFQGSHITSFEKRIRVDTAENIFGNEYLRCA